MAILRILLAVLALSAAATAARAAEAVDLLLVLAADVSRSVDQPKFQLQRDGYAAAINDPRVMNAIMSGATRRIAVCFVEWSGAGAQKVVVDWTLIDGPDAARKFSDALVEAPRSFADRTSISGAIDFSMDMLARAPFRAPRRTVDISGDGTHNSGRGLLAAREDALATGLTINGLVILSEHPLPWNPEHTNPPGGLAKYFQDNVIGGPGAFVVVAENFQSFGQALISKLVAEIALAPSAATGGPHPHP
ncbi:DUF1194 domain-containing protein [Pseudorhodoplanes sp.]|uniref:DUF1194 domain-containing protein n=1 Tax=Pseudorhodoplanes sp. TaxID=1934341 RepID=UPI002C31247F|nr:DUF1194 domain-containing protein [Pseudorhodoplanes sp.]HWV43306.1 DUF1194 domain-containing protein [Pseudorhodoplanes sp.]